MGGTFCSIIRVVEPKILSNGWSHHKIRCYEQWKYISADNFIVLKERVPQVPWVLFTTTIYSSLKVDYFGASQFADSFGEGSDCRCNKYRLRLNTVATN